MLAIPIIRTLVGARRYATVASSGTLACGSSYDAAPAEQGPAGLRGVVDIARTRSTATLRRGGPHPGTAFRTFPTSARPRRWCGPSGGTRRAEGDRNRSRLRRRPLPRPPAARDPARSATGQRSRAGTGSHHRVFLSRAVVLPPFEIPSCRQRRIVLGARHPAVPGGELPQRNVDFPVHLAVEPLSARRAAAAP